MSGYIKKRIRMAYFQEKLKWVGKEITQDDMILKIYKNK